MSTLTKVASLILLADQKLCVLSARINAYVSDRAYEHAQATLKRNLSKANAAEAKARAVAEQRVTAIHKAHVDALRKNSADLTIKLGNAEKMGDAAYEVCDQYEGIGAACYAQAADRDAAAQHLAGVRAQL
jgi:hypothetical protein